MSLFSSPQYPCTCVWSPDLGRKAWDRLVPLRGHWALGCPVPRDRMLQESRSRTDRTLILFLSLPQWRGEQSYIHSYSSGRLRAAEPQVAEALYHVLWLQNRQLLTAREFLKPFRLEGAGMAGGCTSTSPWNTPCSCAAAMWNASTIAFVLIHKLSSLTYLLQTSQDKYCGAARRHGEETSQKQGGLGGLELDVVMQRCQRLVDSIAQGHNCLSDSKKTGEETLAKSWLLC